MTVEVKATEVRELFSWGTEGETTMGENESTPVAVVPQDQAIAVATSPPEAVQSSVVSEVAQPTADAATAETGPVAVDSAAVESAVVGHSPEDEPDLPPVVKVERQADGEFAVVDRNFDRAIANAYATRSAAEIDHELLVKRLAVDFAMAGLAAAKAKAAAKEAAEKQDAALTLLQGAITDGPEEMPLFDQRTQPVAGSGPEAIRSTPPLATEGAGGAVATSAVTTSPPSPATDQVTYDALLRSAKLADLTLTRDGKKVSLKGTIEKLADMGIHTVYGWEKLRQDVSTNQPGAAYPSRIRRDDLEEAVATYLARVVDPLAGAP